MRIVLAVLLCAAFSASAFDPIHPIPADPPPGITICVVDGWVTVHAPNLPPKTFEAGDLKGKPLTPEVLNELWKRYRTIVEWSRQVPVK